MLYRRILLAYFLLLLYYLHYFLSFIALLAIELHTYLINYYINNKLYISLNYYYIILIYNIYYIKF